MPRRPLLIATILLAAACHRPVPPSPPAAVALPPTPGLANLHRWNESLLTGGAPEGDAAFDALQKLGVRTLVSVDALPPDLGRAAARGMIYAHLPIGYDRVPPGRAFGLAKVLRDSPGPVYLHCHHGKHRGPCSAVAALRCLGRLGDDPRGQLARVGTDPHYAGLIDSALTVTVPGAGELDALPAVFPSRAEVAPLAELMVAMDGAFAELKARPTPEGALQLAELYREANRLPEVERRGPDFARQLADGERAALELKAAPAGEGGAGRLVARLGAQCKACHGRYRDGGD